MDGTLLWLHVEFLMDEGMRQERLGNSKEKKRSLKSREQEPRASTAGNSWSRNNP